MVPKFLTLNSKIVLMLLASVVMVLLLVGVLFSSLITDFHQSSAEDKLIRGLELLQIDLLSKKERLVESRKRMERDESILASVNMIWKYQNIDHYQALLFDPEKEALARIVQEEVHGTAFSFAAIYDADGEVIAFYDARTDAAGYISYRDSRPVVLQYRDQGGDAQALSAIPPFLNNLDMHLNLQDQGIHFRHNTGGQELLMESSSPLLKQNGTEAVVIGWLRIAYRLDQRFARRMANQTALAFAIRQQSVIDKALLPEADNALFMINSKGFNPVGYQLDGSMPKLNIEHSVILTPHYVHSNDYFIGTVSLPLEYTENLNVIFALDKSLLSYSLAAFRQAIFWGLLLSGLLVIPMGIIFTRRTVIRPINALVEYAEKVGHGNNNITFKSESVSEFNYLGERLQSMVDRLHDSQDATRASETQIRLLLDSAGEGIYGIDEEGIITFANLRALEILGYVSEEFVGRNGHFVVYPHDSDGQHASQDCPIYSSFREGHSAHVEGAKFWRKDGSSLMTEYRAYPIRKGDKVVGSVITFSDITERKQTESSLELARNIIENAHEAIMVTGLDGVIEQVNDAYVKISGFSRDEVLGLNIEVQRSEHHDARFYAEMWQEIDETGHWDGEQWESRKNGEMFPKWLSINTVRDQSGNPIKYVHIFSDISSLKETERELEQLAYYDALTKLPNRVLFHDRLKQGISTAKRDGHKLATLLIDLDHFKYVNDTLGHDAGDRLLEIVAERLKTFVRDSDTVARLGGDEFIIILTEINRPQEASIIAQKIIDNLNAPIEVRGREVNIGASIGISTYPDDGDNGVLLVKNADLALYKAKDNGRNRYHYFSEELQTAIQDRITMEDEMLKGMTEEQFTIHYQPMIHITSGKVIGMEALMRWNRPGRGDISPERFIPFAEETGLIIPLGVWFLKTACRQMAEFNAELDVPLRMAVNLSAGQFQQRGLLNILQDIIERHNIRPEHIELEITESSVMGDVDEAIVTMQEFRALGFHLAIDDFGTGYSSLSYLKRFPINRLKIDRSFIADLTTELEDAAIVQAIISMADSLQLNVVAEGVETQEQLAFLQANGCEAAQGYLFSRPLPADEFIQYIRDNRS